MFLVSYAHQGCVYWIKNINHSNLLTWCSRNISYYYWKQCCL